MCASSLPRLRLVFDNAQPSKKLLPRPPKGVTFGIRATWEGDWTSMLIQLRGIELASEFDVSKGKHIEIGWCKVRKAMCQRLGASAPWFVRGEDVFDKFCQEHGVDTNVYLEEIFRAKASEKWKYLQDIYKEKKRRTVTVLDKDGNVVQKRANCTGEQRLDDVEWPFYADMQQAMQNRPSICPPAGIVLQSQHAPAKDTGHPSENMGCEEEEDSPYGTLVSTDENPSTLLTHNDISNKRSARNDEADSPKRVVPPPCKKGRRPSSADRRHDERLAAMLDQSSAVTENLKTLRTSITDMQRHYQVLDAEKQLMEAAQKIQRHWDERFAFLLSQNISADVIIEQLGSRPTKEEATQEVQSWQKIVRRTCQS